MAEGFINIAIESDPDVLRQSVYERIQEQFPEWNPAKAVLDKWIIDGCALIGADLGDVAGVVPEEILRQFGETIYKIPALLAEPAVGVITIKIQDGKGYPTIKAGTQMMFVKPDGNKVAFRTQVDVEVPVGMSEVKEVPIESIEPGTEQNQLSDDPHLLDSVSYVTELIQTSANTSGGKDAETPEEYLDRLTVELELLSTAPIVPKDYEKLARRVGMYRAVAIDGWDPVAETEGNERMISVAMVDEEGEGATAKKKEEYEAEVESKREVNFVIHVIDPTYNEINVQVEAVALPGFDKDIVKEQIESALDNYLAARNSGNSPGEPRSWRQNTVVRKNELIWLINTVQGVDYIVGDVKLSKGVGALKAEDVPLTGKAALTKPKTLTVTVVEA
jgi:hypothetical protein